MEGQHSHGLRIAEMKYKRGLMTDQQTKDQYEDNLFLWRKYSRLGEGLGAIINEQQDIILSLQRENKRLKRENWSLKRTNWRIRNGEGLEETVTLKKD